MVWQQQGILRSCILWTTLERAFLRMLARDETFDGLFVCLEKTAAGPKSFFPSTLVFACPSEKSSRTVASSSVPSTPSWDSTRERTTPALLLASAGRKPVVQHIYKGTADCLKNIVAKETLPPASTKSCC